MTHAVVQETRQLPRLKQPAPASVAQLSGPPNENWLVSIGNSDNKLTQAAWAEFMAATVALLDTFRVAWHGRWYSSPTDPWQNANYCFQLPQMPTLAAYMAHAHDLESRLSVLAARYVQDTIAVTRGPVRFIQAASGIVSSVSIAPPGDVYGTEREFNEATWTGGA